MRFVRGMNSWAQTFVGDSHVEFLDLRVPFGLGRIVVEENRFYRMLLHGDGLWVIRPTSNKVKLDFLNGGEAGFQRPVVVSGQGEVRFTLKAAFLDGLPIGEEVRILMQNLHEPFVDESDSE